MRAGLKYTYSDELSVTTRLATGNPNDPISSNQTLTGNFTPKNVNLDWAFVTLTPGKTFGIRPGIFSMTAGSSPPHFHVDESCLTRTCRRKVSEVVRPLFDARMVLDQVKSSASVDIQRVSNAQDGWMFGGQVN